MPMVVLGVTGCIAAYKACEVLRELQRREVDVHVVMTEAATRFVGPMTFEALSRHPVFHDQWALGANSDIRHVSLADAADLLLVAPATANIVGKFAQGIADDALSTLYTATTAPTVVAPAMNVNMSSTRRCRRTSRPCGRGGCGSSSREAASSPAAGSGQGRLAEVAEIVEAAMAALARRRDLAGREGAGDRGPDGGGRRRGALPVEPLLRDDGLPSGRGGPGPRGAGDPGVGPDGPVRARRRSSVVRVRSAAEMARRSTSTSTGPRSSWRRPRWRTTGRRRVVEGKLKKARRRPDPRARADRGHPGRAGHREGRPDCWWDSPPSPRTWSSRARAKLKAKNLDLIVANDVATGFGGETNAAVLVGPGTRPSRCPRCPSASWRIGSATRSWSAGWPRPRRRRFGGRRGRFPSERRRRPARPGRERAVLRVAQPASGCRGPRRERGGG